MALTFNELGEAEFTESDIISYLKQQPTIGELISSDYVTHNQLNSFIETEGSFTHDGSVYAQHVKTIKHALESTHSKTAITSNGFDNFMSGLESDRVEKYFAFISSGTGGFAAVTSSTNPIDGNQYPKGTVLTIGTTPLPGFSFKEWKGQDVGTGESEIQITIRNNFYIEAIFQDAASAPEN